MIDVLINGKWEKKKPSELRTHSNCFYNSKGIYETIKVGGNKIFFIDEHLQRFLIMLQGLIYLVNSKRMKSRIKSIYQ